MSKITVALIGGTGHLGGLIADALLAGPDVRLKMLVRPGSRDKAAALEARGAEIVEGEVGPGGDAALASLVEGAATLVSAVQGGPEMIVDGQAQMLRAAREAGVRRLIPSDFSLDLFRVPEGQIVTSDWRRQFADRAEAERGEVEVVHVLNGGFLDRGVLFGFINVIDPGAGTASYWGEDDKPTYWTTYEDTARYTAAIAIDERPVPRAVRFAGEAASFRQLVAQYEEVTGKSLTVERLGSFADLDARIDELVAGGFGNFGRYLPLMYYRAELKGDGVLEPLDNDRYPTIKAASFRDYVAREGL